MSKYTIVVVDDEEDARELAKIQLESDDDLQLIGEAADGAEAVALIDDARPDIVLLDIQMPELNGMEVVARSRHQPFYIFITAYDEYAVRAFELNAIDYLLKPFTKQRLFAAISKAKKAAIHDGLKSEQFLGLLEDIFTGRESTKTPVQRLTYKSRGLTEYIDTSEIIAINADNQYVNVITQNSQYLLRHSLDYLDEVLDSEVFFRSHRSHIVKLDQVASVEQYEPRNMLIHLKNGIAVKLSQSRKELLNNKLRLG